MAGIVDGKGETTSVAPSAQPGRDYWLVEAVDEDAAWLLGSSNGRGIYEPAAWLVERVVQQGRVTGELTGAPADVTALVVSVR
jgi:hypothetical protein